MDDKIDFGIIGSRTVFRQLCEAGEVDLAWKMVMRPDYPSYLNMLSQDVNTLMETFDGDVSRNHIMFGDIGAWAYEYIAGIRVGERLDDGRLKISIRPYPPRSLKSAGAVIVLPEGVVKVEWRRMEDRFEVAVETPERVSATVTMPDGIAHQVVARHEKFMTKTGY
jgi:alpha-L-rhamnosidase